MDTGENGFRHDWSSARDAVSPDGSRTGGIPDGAIASVSGLAGKQRTVETAYCEGCGHHTFFTNSAQRDDELNAFIAAGHSTYFLRARGVCWRMTIGR